MHMNLTKPCDNCPFRTDVDPFLTSERVEEICHGLIESQSTFACHKTTEFDEDAGGHINSEDEEHCAGALIMLEKLDRPNQMMRWMERLGQYDRTKLDMESPVFDCADEMIEAQPR